jgi:hypothetical protein
MYAFALPSARKPHPYPFILFVFLAASLATLAISFLRLWWL